LARPREFNEDKALEGAMNVFWAHGYEGASLPELLKGMGLTRGSLYKAYKDKKSLFINILHRYDEAEVEKATQLLGDENLKDGLDRIDKLFASVLSALEQEDYRGCLLCSAAAGPAHNDKQISEAVHGLLNKMKSGFEIALKDSSQHAELSKERLGQLADLLLTQYVGLRILSRSQASKETLKRSISSLMILLNSEKE
jgi:TetR/AcrR family transcriptional repressor of nem operon